MTNAPNTVRLLEADPDFGRFLIDDERDEARVLSVPVQQLRKGPLELTKLFEGNGGFGAIVLKGMIMHRLRAGDQLTVRLLGPGDFLFMTGAPRSMLLGESTCIATGLTELAILGNEVLAALRRLPRLAAGIYVRVAEQTDRLAAQLAICQLPRVDQRILSLLWLLAESWGHVGSAGTSLPISLTHDALGALIGARRPTVTLALGELSERGAIVRQDGGWLLLEEPPVIAVATESRSEEPELLVDHETAWRGDPTDKRDEDSHQELFRTIQVLRQEHAYTRDETRDRLVMMRKSRERCSELRRAIADRRATPPAP